MLVDQMSWDKIVSNMGIKKNDEVLVPSITYVATYQAITAVGAKPVGCDINEEDLQISIKDIKKKFFGTKMKLTTVSFTDTCLGLLMVKN